MEVIKLGYKMTGTNMINAPQYIQGIEDATTNFIQSIVDAYNNQTNKKIINYEVIAINEVKGNYINFAKVNLYSNQTVQGFGVGGIVNALFSYLIASWQALVMAGLVALALFGLLKVDRLKITAEGVGSVELGKDGNVVGDLPPGGGGGGNDGGSSGGNDGGGSNDSKSKRQSSFPIWLLGILALGYFAFRKK